MELTYLQLQVLEALKAKLKDADRPHMTTSIHTICMMYLTPVPSFPQVAAALGALRAKGLVEKRPGLNIPVKFKGYRGACYYPTSKGKALLVGLKDL